MIMPSLPEIGCLEDGEPRVAKERGKAGQVPVAQATIDGSKVRFRQVAAL
jgi:hypothetical protein